jgi:DnaJ-class molecular chaperone
MHDYDEDEGDPPEGRHRCRHCTAVGRECEDCDGTGVHEGYWFNAAGQEMVDSTDCPTCEGWGVIDETVGEPVVHRRNLARLDRDGNEGGRP